MERIAQSAAALQVTQHGFGYDMDRVRILGPFQLPLARAQMFEHVAEPEQVGFTLTHSLTHLSTRCAIMGTIFLEQSPCQDITARPVLRRLAIAK